jgi:hypothetical protein
MSLYIAYILLGLIIWQVGKHEAKRWHNGKDYGTQERADEARERGDL